MPDNGAQVGDCPCRPLPRGKECTNFFMFWLCQHKQKNYNNRTWHNAFFAQLAPAARNSPLVPWIPLSRNLPPLSCITSDTLGPHNFQVARCHPRFMVSSNASVHSTTSRCSESNGVICSSNCVIMVHWWSKNMNGRLGWVEYTVGATIIRMPRAFPCKQALQNWVLR